MKRRILASTVDEVTKIREVRRIKEAMQALQNAMDMSHRETIYDFDLNPLYDELNESLMGVAIRLESMER